MVVPLTAYGLLSWFSRYASDDYCTASITVTQGFFDAQVYWYRAWSGRYTFTALVSLLELFGSRVTQVMPALGMLVWIGVTTWACLPVACLAGWRFPRLASLVIAEVVVFSTLAAAPNIGQSFYMQAGLVTYTVPLVLVTLYAGWVLRTVIAADVRGPSLGAVAVSGVAMLLIGGLNETTASVYTAGLGLAGVFGVLRLRGSRRRTLLWLMVAGVAGSLVATLLMAVAPGTHIRITQEGDPGFSLARVPQAWGASVSLSIAVARRFEALSRPTFLFTLILPLALGWAVTSGRSGAPGRPGVLGVLGSVLMVVLIAAIGLGLMALSLFPSYVIQGYDPPARIQQISDYALVLALAAAGYVVGDLLRRLTHDWRLLPMARLAVGVGLILLTAVPLRESLYVFGQVPVEAAYAADWDRDDQVLRTAQPAADGVVKVAPLPPRWNWAFVDAGPGDFPNVCVARYYGLPAVVSSGPAPAWTGATEPGGRSPGVTGGVNGR